MIAPPSQQEVPVIDLPPDPISSPVTKPVKVLDLDQKDSVVLRQAFDNLEFETDQDSSGTAEWSC